MAADSIFASTWNKIIYHFFSTELTKITEKKKLFGFVLPGISGLGGEFLLILFEDLRAQAGQAGTGGLATCTTASQKPNSALRLQRPRAVPGSERIFYHRGGAKLSEFRTKTHNTFALPSPA